MASLPVVGYLSFLASNSPIASDFIALADHLNIKTDKPLKIYETLNYSEKKKHRGSSQRDSLWDLVRRTILRLPAKKIQHNKQP